jgi:hypothetical protein
VALVYPFPATKVRPPMCRSVGIIPMKFMTR